MNSGNQAPTAPAFIEHYDSLAQWKIERGEELRSGAWGYVIVGLFYPVIGWFISLVVLPFAIYNGHKGKRMVKEGREEGGHGRPQVGGESAFIPLGNFERRVDAGVRRYDASMYPPGYLRTPDNAEDFDRYAPRKTRTQ